MISMDQNVVRRALNRTHPSADLQQSRNFRAWLRVGLHFHKGVAVMRGNDIGVGKPPIRTSSRPATGSLTFERSDDQQKADRREPRPVFCGAMSQQRDDSGAQSMPQKLVQLVGCRDPKPDDPKASGPKATRPKPGSPKVRTQLKR